MQSTSSFILSKLIEEKRTLKGPSEQTLLHYKELADIQRDGLAVNHARFLSAKELIEKQCLVEGLKLAQEIIASQPDDPQSRNDFYHLLNLTHEKLMAMAMHDSANLQVGSVYKSLIDFGVGNMHLHYVVLQHYLLIGDLESAKDLLARFLATAPNYAGLKELEAQFKNLSKEKL